MDTNVIVATGGSALIVSTLLQILKNSPWFPWLTRQTGKLNLAASILAAFAAAVGISYSFDFNPDGTFAFGFHGSLTDVAHGLWHWVVQWCAQQGWYKGFVVPAETLGEIRALLAKVLTPPAISEGAAKAGPEPVPSSTPTLPGKV